MSKFFLIFMNILLSVDYGIYFFMICSSSYSIMVCLYRIVIVGIIYLYCITLHCIAFSYVATRDIPEGAEILLNYGSDWENGYHRHVQNWKSQSWNKRNHDDAIDNDYQWM